MFTASRRLRSTWSKNARMFIHEAGWLKMREWKTWLQKSMQNPRFGNSGVILWSFNVTFILKSILVYSYQRYSISSALQVTLTVSIFLVFLSCFCHQLSTIQLIATITVTLTYILADWCHVFHSYPAYPPPWGVSSLQKKGFNSQYMRSFPILTVAL